MSTLLTQVAEPQTNNKPRKSLGPNCPQCGAKKGDYRSRLCVKCFADKISIPRIIYPDVYFLEDGSPYRKIDLTHGHYAMVDMHWYEYLMQWRWHARKNGKLNLYYAVRMEKSKNIHMHRVITNAPDDKDVDHENHIGTDNREKNLTVCTEEENLRNQNVSRRSTSGYRGVSWNTRYKKWKVGIFVNKVRKHLGYFNDPIEGAKIFDIAALKHHGRFARLNFPELKEMYQQIISAL